MSPIFYAPYGFGGEGARSSTDMKFTFTKNATMQQPNVTCIGSGPFSGLMHNAGPGYQLQTLNPHCLTRNIQTALADDTLQWKNDVMPVLAINDYFNMSFAMTVPTTGKVRGIHGAAHYGVDGEVSHPSLSLHVSVSFSEQQANELTKMGNIWSSINDPLFFMHHTMIDYVWWIWQNRAPQNDYAMGGLVYANGSGGMTTLDYSVSMAPYIAPDVFVRKVMDPLNGDGKGILCFTYEGNGMPVAP